jgi:hypothetical protein
MTVVFDGTINADDSSGTLYIEANSSPTLTFTNNGSITVSSGDILYIEPTTFTNTGTVTVDSASTISIGSSGTATAWSNTGTITANTDATLNMWGTFATASLIGGAGNGTVIDDGATVNLDGTLTNTGATLAVGSGGTFGTLTLASTGEIIGGTIMDAGSGMAFKGGTLNGVTYEGTMNLTPASSSVYIVGALTTGGGSTVSLTAETSGGGLPGAINIGASDDFYFMDSQTFNNATINLEGTGATLAAYVSYAAYNAHGGEVAETLTLGSGVTIDQISGSTGYLDTGGSDFGPMTVVFDGTINADDSSGTLYIEANSSPTLTFTNNGSITVSSGDTVDVVSAETGAGSYTVDANSTVEFDSSVASGATVYFGAPTGTLYLTQPSNFSGQISGMSGSDIIDLKGFNATYTTATPTFNSGTDTTTLLVTDPHDSLSVSLTLDGNYSGDTFTPSADSHGNGTDLVDPPAPVVATIINGASLDVGAPSNETVIFTGGTGSLVLNDPEGYTGQIVGFTGTAPDAAHSDTIDLVGINYDSSSFADTYNSETGLLTVTDGTHSASITFDDFNATLDFASDGDGGTLITDPPAAHSSGDTSGAPTDWGMKFGSDKIALDSGQPQDQSGGWAGVDGQKALLVSLNGGGDNFVFHHDLVENTVSLDPHGDAGELPNHPDAQLAHQLAALITPDPHAEAIYDLIHNDILAQNGQTPAQIHHLIQAGHLLY